MSGTGADIIATDLSATRVASTGNAVSSDVVVAWSDNAAAATDVQYQIYRSNGGTAFDPTTAVLVATTAQRSAVVADPTVLTSTAAYFGVAAIARLDASGVVTAALDRVALLGIDWTGLVDVGVVDVGTVGPGGGVTSSDSHYKDGQFVVDRSKLDPDDTKPGANVTPTFTVTTPNPNDDITFQYDPGHQAPVGTGPGLILKSSGKTDSDGNYSGSFYVDKRTTPGTYVFDVLVNGATSGNTITIVVK